MKTIGPIIRVAVPSPLRRLFDYLPPTQVSGKLLPGIRVRVPFGRKSIIGIVVEHATHSEVPAAKLKYVEKMLDNTSLFSSTLFELLLWAADYYQHPLGEVLAQALPTLLRQGEIAEIAQETFWYLTSEGEQIECEGLKRAPKQWQVLQQLRDLKKLQEQQHGFSAHELSALGIKSQALQLLKNKNLVIFKKKNKNNQIEQKKRLGPTLNDDQAQAVKTVLAQENHFIAFLLQGVTGSGKTEVYLSILEKILISQQQALVLVPEIGLTPQTVKRFRERLGNKIGILHSGITDKQRLQTWLKARNGEISVIIGTRSAIFTPFMDLKLLIIDESHDLSFKQWDGFKYHARDLAVRRAQLENIPIIMGSATPSLASLHNVLKGRFHLLSLPQRAGDANPTHFKLIDMSSQSIKEGFAQTTLQSLQEHLQQGNQVLVFINRRGYAPMVMCHECGWVAECDRCHTAFTLHQNPQRLQCHHCGKNRALPSSCPECHHTQLLNVGVGTERVEQFLQQQFKDKKIARIDRDSTRKKGALEKQLEAINNGTVQILVGTQMLAKGHHFPNVTLVIALNIDGGLYSADYAGSERMAQLLLQVAGRAGRAEKPGEILIQTYHPQHPLLQLLIHEGYAAFATQALEKRQLTVLPPYHYFALMRCEAVNSTVCKIFLSEVKQFLTKKNSTVQLLGPLPAPIEKRVGRFRWQLLLSASKRSALHQLLKRCLPEIENLKSSRKVRWSIDIDPVDML